jgi:hypothetical protein
MSEKGGLAVKTPVKNGKDPGSKKPKADLSHSQLLDSPVEQILYLQRTIGNRAVTHLFQSGAIQARLKISKPNDIYEKEADRVSARVMGMRDRSLVNGHWSSVQRESPCPECPEKEGIQTKPPAEQITPLVQRQTEEEEEPVQAKLLQRQEKEEEEIQTKQALNQTPEVTPNIESNINSMKGGGQPLSESTRAFFEPRFGTDFSQVRLHTDDKAGKIARSINAKAFTTGKDIVFNSGQYSPGTSSGKHLLAHELTHVVQQNVMTFSDKKIQGLFEKINLGGEVNNNTDIPWLISGKSNSRIEDFIWLPLGKNSDDIKQVEEQLDGDVDAVWPNSTPVKNKETGKMVRDGAFKLKDMRNTDIDGTAKKGYEISSFSKYFSEGKLPKGWALPGALRRK